MGVGVGEESRRSRKSNKKKQEGEKKIEIEKKIARTFELHSFSPAAFLRLFFPLLRACL